MNFKIHYYAILITYAILKNTLVRINCLYINIIFNIFKYNILFDYTRARNESCVQ